MAKRFKPRSEVKCEWDLCVHGLHHTACGRLKTPQPVAKPLYSSIMKNTDYKAVLWANVSTLMIAKYGKENLTRLASDSGAGPGTMTRIKNAKTSVGVDVLEKIGEVFGVTPWQLLHPDISNAAEKQRPDEVLALRQLYQAISPEFKAAALGAATHAMIPFLQHHTTVERDLCALDTKPSEAPQPSKEAHKTL